MIPIELCTVLPEQLMRKQFPEDKTNDMVEFARKRPAERLAAIREGLKVRLAFEISVGILTFLVRFYNMARVNMSDDSAW
jgi:uncharacterized protein YpbB